MQIPPPAISRLFRFICAGLDCRSAAKLPALLVAGLLALSLCSAVVAATSPLPKPYPLPARFKARVEMFRLYDQAEPSVKGGIVFVGSSLITGWNKRIEGDFPSTNVIARGFGGSTILDQTTYADITVLPHEPRQIVFYGGADDVLAGRSPEGVLEDFKKFCELVGKTSPNTKILYLSPLPTEGITAEQQKDLAQANQLISNYCASQPTLSYLDTSAALADKNHKVSADVFTKGGQMLNDKGYKMLAQYVARGLTPEPFPFANKADIERAKKEKNDRQPK